MRQMAGLLLKNNVKRHWDVLHTPVQAYVRSNLIGALGDCTLFIRQTAGSCITAVAFSAGLQAWPELIPRLAAMLDAKAEIDHQNKEGSTALMFACFHGFEVLAKLLPRPAAHGRAAQACTALAGHPRRAQRRQATELQDDLQGVVGQVCQQQHGVFEAVASILDRRPDCLST